MSSADALESVEGVVSAEALACSTGATSGAGVTAGAGVSTAGAVASTTGVELCAGGVVACTLAGADIPLGLKCSPYLSLSNNSPFTDLGTCYKSCQLVQQLLLDKNLSNQKTMCLS